MADNDGDDRTKKERSPSYPFISLAKAVERAQAFYNNHRREPTRLAAVAETWEYSTSSSGLLQTVAALKQFGLLDEVANGTGPDRKVQISELARRILSDERPGAREQAITEAAKRPKLIGEYLPKWVPHRPTDSHCISDLHFDRGFNQPAAKTFLKVFDETVAFAKLDKSVRDEQVGQQPLTHEAEEPVVSSNTTENLPPPPAQQTRDVTGLPLSQRLQVLSTGDQLTVSATLFSGKEVDKLIRVLEANKMLLDDPEYDL
jgi:hypothetical protein